MENTQRRLLINSLLLCVEISGTKAPKHKTILPFFLVFDDVKNYNKFIINLSADTLG